MTTPADTYQLFPVLDSQSLANLKADVAERGVLVPVELDEDGLAVSADQAAAERLIGRNARSLARVADPRQRRQRAYALLARNGFDPEVCRTVASGLVDDSESAVED